VAEAEAKAAHSFQRRYIKLETFLAEGGIQWNMNSKTADWQNSK